MYGFVKWFLSKNENKVNLKIKQIISHQNKKIKNLNIWNIWNIGQKITVHILEQ